MDEGASVIEHPVARILLAIIPAALVFLFFVSVLLCVAFLLWLTLCRRCFAHHAAAVVRAFSVPAVQTSLQPPDADALYEAQDVLSMLDDTAPSLPYARWLDDRRRRQKPSPSPALVLDNALCVICLEVVDAKDEIRDLPCLHVFHTACLDGWIARGHYYCPLCHRLVLHLLRDQDVRYHV